MSEYELAIFGNIKNSKNKIIKQISLGKAIEILNYVGPILETNPRIKLDSPDKWAKAINRKEGK